MLDKLLNFLNVEEPNPLKQGLKLRWAKEKECKSNVEEPNPLKQGLKQFF